MRFRHWITVAFVVLILCLASAVQAASLTVTWYPNSEPDLAGYKVYYGTASGQYGPPITLYCAEVYDGPEQCRYQLIGLEPATTYYVVLTAFNLAGFESGFSEEAFATTFGIGGGGKKRIWYLE